MPDEGSSSEETISWELAGIADRAGGDRLESLPEADFPIVLRGYDRQVVDAYVEEVSEMIAELSATRVPSAAVRRALDRVGEEVAGILQQAHETAAEVTATSREQADERLKAAERDAQQIIVRAHERLRQLDAETDRVWAERDRIVGDARDLSRELQELADAAAERFPAEEEAETTSLSAVESATDESADSESVTDESPAVEGATDEGATDSSATDGSVGEEATSKESGGRGQALDAPDAAPGGRDVAPSRAPGLETPSAPGAAPPQTSGPPASPSSWRPPGGGIAPRPGGEGLPAGR